MEEGTTKGSDLPIAQVVNGNDSPDQMQGSSKADLIDNTSCENDEQCKEVADSSVLDGLLLRYLYTFE